MTNAYWLLGSIGCAAIVANVVGNLTWRRLKKEEAARIQGVKRQETQKTIAKWKVVEREVNHISLREEFLLDLEWNR